MTEGTCSVPECPSAVHCKGYCRPHYMRFYRYGDPCAGGPPRPRAVISDETFWAQVNKQGPLIASRPDLGRCWIWLGRLNNGGYGVFGTRGRVSTPVYVIAWELSGRPPLGPAEEYDHLCHTLDLTCPGGRCSHRSCLNPDHLEPVSHRENALRSVRARTGRCRFGHPLIVVGMRNGYPKRGCPTCTASRRRSHRDECMSDESTPRVRNVRVPDELLGEVASVYEESTTAGGPPRLAVARHFTVSPATASWWIGKARAAGHLKPYAA